MKNLMVAMVLTVGLMGYSTAFAESTDKTADIVAFQDVENTVLSASEMETTGVGIISIFWGGICIAWGKDTCNTTPPNIKLSLPDGTKAELSPGLVTANPVSNVPSLVTPVSTGVIFGVAPLAANTIAPLK
jgi:hypothetical protein